MCASPPFNSLGGRHPPPEATLVLAPEIVERLEKERGLNLQGASEGSDKVGLRILPQSILVVSKETKRC